MKRLSSLICAVIIALCGFGIYKYYCPSNDSSVSSELNIEIAENENMKFSGVPTFDNMLNKYEDVLNEIKKGYDNHYAEIDIYSYKITLGELIDLIQYLSINNGYYYVDNNYKYLLDSNGYVFKYMPLYNMEIQEIQKCNEIIESQLKAVVSEAEKLSTNVEKLIFVHNYLIENIDYDTNKNINYNNIYGALVNKKSMCIGYSEAFCKIAQMLGFKCYIVISDELIHAWNMVLLNGNYYFVDCTWDDPVISNDSLAMYPVSEYGYYKYFLCSQAYFYDNEHYSTDWKVNGCDIADVAKSEIYDDYFWHDYNSLMQYAGNSWYAQYGYSDDNVEYTWDIKFSIDKITFFNDKKCSKSIIRTINTFWSMGYGYYLTFNSKIDTAGDSLYYMTAKGIYELVDGGNFFGNDDKLVFENPYNNNIYDFAINEKSETFIVAFGKSDLNNSNNASFVTYNLADYFN